jgi:hypothetical protein
VSRLPPWSRAACAVAAIVLLGGALVAGAVATILLMQAISGE